MNIIETLQDRLADLGYYTGVVDNEPGQLTSDAVVLFKKQHGLAARDYVGPLTLSILFSAEAKPFAKASENTANDLPWMIEARKQMGLNEKTDRQELAAWLRSDGSSVGDPSKIPWCGDFVETCLRKTLPHDNYPDNPYGARNWSKFGIPCALIPGAIAVFWRGSPNGWKGHVGFVVSANDTHIMILGGNQKNSVSIAKLDRSRLLECRWPNTFPLVRRPTGSASSTHVDVDIDVSVNEE